MYQLELNIEICSVSEDYNLFRWSQMYLKSLIVNTKKCIAVEKDSRRISVSLYSSNL